MRSPRLVALALIACGHTDPVPPPPSPLEATIARELGVRFGVPVVALCFVWLDIPRACRARLPDGSMLPIRVTDAGQAWEWTIDGMVVATGPIEAYLRDTLGDLAVTQNVHCAPSVRVLLPGERIACTLAGGGRAFVTVNADGSTAVEVVLDPASAAARADELTPEREQELVRRSRALEPTEADEADEADEAKEERKPAPADATPDGSGFTPAPKVLR